MVEMRVRAFFSEMPHSTDETDARTPLDIQVDRFCGLIMLERYTDAYQAMREEQSLTGAEKLQIITAINKQYLFKRNLEWCNHGIKRTFRFWIESEKQEYLGRAMKLADTLKLLSPFVTFGFGSVLGFVRDNDFIPHDDDMDLLIAFPDSVVSSFAHAKKSIRDLLEADGFRVYNDNLTHFIVNGVDVFVGFIESDGSVSWFPSRRGGLRVGDVFPTTTREVLGINCEIPRDYEKYLEVTYGEEWRHPIANWNHPWDQSKYRDYGIDNKVAN